MGPGVYAGVAGIRSAACDTYAAGGGGGGSIGAAAAADLAVATTFYPGSGGGAGGGPCTCSKPGGGGGGGGGGALRIAAASTLTVTGSIRANGGVGGNALQGASGGGGGSGGVIHLFTVSTLNVSGTVSAAGGAGGTTAGCPNNGGAGGMGRIKISALTSSCTLGGSFNPPLQSGCTPAGAIAGRAYVETVSGGGLGTTCTSGVGACARTGTLVCNSSQNGTTCNATAGSPTTETCNNVDDNCNGSVDESLTQTCYSGPGGTAGVGACRAGTSTCSAGAYGACVGQVVPATETCDGVDNDCDGIVDDGFCRIGGVCYNNGQANPSTTCQTCVAAANVTPPTTWTNVTNGTVCGSPTGGVCTNGTCGCPSGQTSCSGVCRVTGAACTAGVGVCLRSGTIVCSGTSTACSVTPGAPGTESCNGLDDDCNGTVDNGVVSTCSAPEGLGTLLVGQTASFSQFVAAPAGSERWYVVNFPGGAGGTPTVTISGAGVSSGQIRMEVRTSCGALPACPSGGYPGTQWSFTDNASVAGTGYRTRNVAWPATMYVRVYRVASTTTCGNFTITATRP